MSCSALKVYDRDILREADPGVWFLHLEVDPDVIARRVASRSNHFMPASLIASQFQTLEQLQANEAGVVIDASGPPEDIVRIALAHLDADRSSA